MIVFDLCCADGGHIFEAWFGKSSDYEDQRARGLISCPLCGSSDVGKALMAPNVAPKGNRRKGSDSHAVALPTPQAMKTMLNAMAQAQAKMLEGSTWVGSSFADQARAIHHGEREAGPIHGEASASEAEALVDEGVSIAPLPFPVLAPETRN